MTSRIGTRDCIKSVCAHAVSVHRRAYLDISEETTGLYTDTHLERPQFIRHNTAGPESLPSNQVSSTQSKPRRFAYGGKAGCLACPVTVTGPGTSVMFSKTSIFRNHRSDCADRTNFLTSSTNSFEYGTHQSPIKDTRKKSSSNFFQVPRSSF